MSVMTGLKEGVMILTLVGGFRNWNFIGHKIYNKGKPKETKGGAWSDSEHRDYVEQYTDRTNVN